MAHYLAITLALCSRLPWTPYIDDAVDVIEVNHKYSASPAECCLAFDQVIFWRLNAAESRYEVVAWRMLEGVRHERDRSRKRTWIGGHATPKQINGVWQSVWFDKKHGVWRRVTAVHAFHSWTLHDPEMDDRQFVAVAKRQGLTRPSLGPIQAMR